MAIKMTGMSTDLPINDWITQLVQAKQVKIDAIVEDKAWAETSQSALSTVKTSYSSLLSSVEKLTDSSFGSTSDLFAQKAVSSSESAVSATVTSLADVQTLDVKVTQLAKSTVAKGENTAAATMDGTTLVSKLAQGNVTEGDFSIYVDNQKHTISVASTDSVDDILGRIQSETGLTATVTDGKLRIEDETATKSVVLGSNADSSNFLNAVGMTKLSEGVFESNMPELLADSTVALTSADAGFKEIIRESSFKIGNATFTVDSEKTMNDLVSEINASEDAGVKAYWDSGSGKLVLESKTEGASNINIENISGNFTDVMGFTTSTFNPDDTVATTKLADNSQTLGTHAILEINGTEVISASNTVTSEVSGVQGLTLTLNEETEVGKNSEVAIKRDDTSLLSSINIFVSDFNKVISQTDEATGSDGFLKGESVLNMIRNNLRSSVTSSVETEGEYKTLASIGITTGEVGSSIDMDTDKLVVDEDVLKEALAKDPEAVKELLIGSTSGGGVMGKLETIVDGALDPVDGYFTARDKSMSSEISDLEDTIERKTEDLEAYKLRTEARFAAMEELLASLNAQLDTVNNVTEQVSNMSKS